MRSELVNGREDVTMEETFEADRERRLRQKVTSCGGVGGVEGRETEKLDKEVIRNA